MTQLARRSPHPETGPTGCGSGPWAQQAHAGEAHGAMPRVVHLLHGSGIPPPLYTPAQAEDQSELMDSPEIKGFAVTTQQVL